MGKLARNMLRHYKGKGDRLRRRPLQSQSTGLKTRRYNC